MYFRNLVLSAFVTAIVAGLVFSCYQFFFITPILLSSEIYEILEPINHQIVIWSPTDGMERNSWSFVTNFLLCFAYALILVSAMTIKGSVNTVKGFYWGLAAFIALFVSPALGLPPEIPGMEASQLENRQSWWIMTVIVSIIALWLMVYQRKLYKALGLLLMVMPHIIGAPQPEVHGFVNTDPQAIKELTDLWHQFIVHTTIANALMWIAIGTASGFLTNKFISPLDALEENNS